MVSALNPPQPGVAYLCGPENRKPEGFLFSGGIDKQYRTVMGLLHSPQYSAQYIDLLVVVNLGQ